MASRGHRGRECQGQDLPLCVKPRRFALRVLPSLAVLTVKHCEAVKWKNGMEGNRWNRKFYTVLAFWVWSDFAQACKASVSTREYKALSVTMRSWPSLFPGALVVVDPGLG